MNISLMLIQSEKRIKEIRAFIDFDKNIDNISFS